MKIKGKNVISVLHSYNPGFAILHLKEDSITGAYFCQGQADSNKFCSCLVANEDTGENTVEITAVCSNE